MLTGMIDESRFREGLEDIFHIADRLATIYLLHSLNAIASLLYYLREALLQ